MIAVDVEKKLKDFELRCRFEAENELVALFGPSGSGKSLTLQCIAGLMNPDAGRIAIDGNIVFDASKRISLPPRERRIGYVFQNYALFPHFTVSQNIEYGLHHLPKRERHQRMVRVVKQMRLEGLESSFPRELSGGQQQRVAIGRAIVIEPSILLLDEPFSALDSAIRSKLRTELLQLLQSLSMTTILVTHNLDEAYMLSEKMVVYDTGQVLQVGTRDEIMHRPASRPVARFTGTKNIFGGTVVRATKDDLEIAADGFSVTTPPYERSVGDRVQFCIRPDRIMLLRPEIVSGEQVKENQLEGQIVEEINHGSSVTLFFKISGMANGKNYDLQIEVPAHIHYKLDLSNRKDWRISLKKRSIHVF